jgi:hypothetical protein
MSWVCHGIRYINHGVLVCPYFTGQPPFGFPQERMRINWRSGFTAPSPRWAALLDGLLEPVAEDRLTAAQALQALRGSAVQRERRQAVQVGKRGEAGYRDRTKQWGGTGQRVVEVSGTTPAMATWPACALFLQAAELLA